MEKQTNDSEKVLEEIVVTPYKYGFKTEIENENFPKGFSKSQNFHFCLLYPPRVK